MSPGNTPIKRQAKRPKVQLISEAEKLTEFSDWFRQTAQIYNPELFVKPTLEAAPKVVLLLRDTNKAFARIQEIFTKIVRQAPPSLNSELLHKQQEFSNLADIREFDKTRLDKQQKIFYSIANLLDETITLVTVQTVSEKKDGGKGRGQPKNKEAEKSIDSLKELLKNETPFSDMPKGTRKESWEWIADKIGYPKNPQNKTPRYKIMQGYLGRNCPKLYAKLKRIVEKN